MAKKNRADGFAYSTDASYSPPTEDDAADALVAPSQQNLRITRRRLKGNKVVTVVYDFEGPDLALATLGKALKSHCGVGGSTKAGEVLLQGDVVDKAAAWLEKEGYCYKKAGI